VLADDPRLTPWAAFFRRFAATTTYVPAALDRCERSGGWSPRRNTPRV